MTHLPSNLHITNPKAYVALQCREIARRKGVKLATKVLAETLHRLDEAADGYFDKEGNYQFRTWEMLDAWQRSLRRNSDKILPRQFRKRKFLLALEEIHISVNINMPPEVTRYLPDHGYRYWLIARKYNYRNN